MTKIDCSYYPEVHTLLSDMLSFLSQFVNVLCVNPQTLHKMYVVNAGPGFKKMLWPAAQKFLDQKTISKIQVLVSDQYHLHNMSNFSCQC